MPRGTMANPIPAPSGSAPVVQLQPTPTAPSASRPGAMRREDAAAYCGVGATTWDAWRSRGLVPDPLPPIRDASGRVRILQWATAHLDLWLLHGRPERGKFRAILEATRRPAR